MKTRTRRRIRNKSRRGGVRTWNPANAALPPAVEETSLVSPIFTNAEASADRVPSPKSKKGRKQKKQNSPKRRKSNEEAVADESAIMPEARMPSADARMPSAEARMPSAEARMPEAEARMSRAMMHYMNVKKIIPADLEEHVQREMRLRARKLNIAYANQERADGKSALYPLNRDTQLSEEILFLVLEHATAVGPFLLPLNVTRHLGTDLGTCNFTQPTQTNELHRMFRPDKYNRKLSTKDSWETITDRIVQSIHHNAERGRKEAPQQHPEEHLKFRQSKHHTKHKYFEKGEPMMDKEFDSQGGRINIGEPMMFIRNRDGSYVKELNVTWLGTPKVLLSTLLQMFANNGVQHVHLFDLSCSPYEGDAADFKYFGGNGTV